jgi:diguanylate cyclase (GGDEF)-like protein/PAS domain S-box-containing protein
MYSFENTGRYLRESLSPWFRGAGAFVASAMVLVAAGSALMLAKLSSGHPAFGLPAYLATLTTIAAALWMAQRLRRTPHLDADKRSAWQWTGLALTAAFASRGATLAGHLTDAAVTAPLAAVADLAAGLLLAVGLIGHHRAMRHGRSGARFWLDTGAIALSFSACYALLILRPLAASPAIASGDLPQLIAAPLVDGVLLVVAAVLLLREPDPRRSAAHLWLAAAICARTTADLLTVHRLSAGDVRAGDWAMVTGMFWPALIAWAAQAEIVASLRKTAEGTSRIWTRITDLAPVIALILSLSILVYQQLDTLALSRGVMSLVVAAVAGLVIARQALSAREFAQMRAGLAVRSAESKFATLLRNSADVIAIVDADWRLRFLTPSAQRVFGHPVETLIGRTLASLVVPDDSARVQELPAALAVQGSTQTLELRVRRKEDRVCVIEMVVTNLVDDATVGGWVLNIRDITDRKALEEQLKRLAFHDPLTLLANRALFRNRVEHALDAAKRHRRPIAVIFVDLDNFKKINDSLGHGVGDRVLRTSAQRLVKCTRSCDTVARLGGDEFAVLLEDAVAEPLVLEIAARIVEALQQPFTFGGSDLRVAASVGVTFAVEGEGVEELLRNADVAMYHAKGQGKGRYAVFQPQMHKAVRERLRIEADLSRAIARDEFQLHYQPVVDLKSGYLIGVEALVRWKHPERGLVNPQDFIGVAEDTGQVLGLGRWVLRQACMEVRAWQRCVARGDELRVAVNVSARQLQSADLVAEVTRALQESGLNPGSLVIEMTESVVMQNTEVTLRKLQRLKALGVRIAIDDFGTGYSSLSYLHRFPIDILKIDRSFVQRLGQQRDGAELARAIITLGDALDLEVVAEGIETEEQQRELLALGCVAGQGFYYSRPGMLHEIEYSIPARRRQLVTNNLPQQVDTTATGRFTRAMLMSELDEIAAKRRAGEA